MQSSSLQRPLRIESLEMATHVTDAQHTSEWPNSQEGMAVREGMGVAAVVAAGWGVAAGVAVGEEGASVESRTRPAWQTQECLDMKLGTPSGSGYRCQKGSLLQSAACRAGKWGIMRLHV